MGGASNRKTLSLADQAYAAIKNDILCCRLAPGSRVSEGGLCADYPYGKAGVRAAMQRLAQEGLVIAYPRQGYLVAPVTAQDVMDLFAVRLLLEPAAARLAAGRVDPARLRELDRMCRVGYDPNDPASVEEFQSVNRQFHMLVAEAGGNLKLARYLGNVIDEMHRFYYLGLTLPHRDHPQHESGHRRLVEALEAGDPDLAERVSREGLEEAQRNCLDALLTLPDLQAARLRVHSHVGRNRAVVAR